MKNTTETGKFTHARSQFDKGVDAYNQDDFRTARNTFKAALEAYETLVEEGRSDLRPELALTRMNYGVCLIEAYEALFQEGHDELHPDLELMPAVKKPVIHRSTKRSFVVYHRFFYSKN